MFGDEESLLIDTTGDGILDTMQAFSDTNSDGVADVMSVGDGLIGDGVPDDICHDIDTTYEGIFDTHVEEYHIDANGDGYIDTVIFASDENSTGIFEMVEVYQDQDGDGTFELVPLDEPTFDYIEIDGELYPSGILDSFPNFDSNDSNIDTGAVIGDPGADMDHWVFQGDTNRCALHSQMFVIEGLFDNELSIKELEQIAEAHGWYDDGTPPEYINKILDYFGIENEMSFNNDLSDIAECLDSGGKVIVAVDSGKIWDTDYNSEIYAPGEANHALQVIGLDSSDPQNPMVILNDSGHPDGSGAMIPAGQFIDAWGESGFQMVAAC